MRITQVRPELVGIMNEDVAYLIARMAHAISDEGIWHHVDLCTPDGQQAADDRIIDEAVRTAWNRLDAVRQHDLALPVTTDGECP